MKGPTWQEIEDYRRNRPSFGRRIRERRELKKMTIMAISREARAVPSFWSDMEHDRVWPTDDMIPFLAGLFDTTPGLLKQDLERYHHDIKKYFEKHKNVIDWFKRMKARNEAY